MSKYLITSHIDTSLLLEQWFDTLDKQQREALALTLNAPGSPVLNLPDPEEAEQIG